MNTTNILIYLFIGISYFTASDMAYWMVYKKHHSMGMRLFIFLLWPYFLLSNLFLSLLFPLLIKYKSYENRNG